MKNFVLILITFLFIEYSFSQENSTEQLYKTVNEYVTKLKSNKVDTICVYRDYYSGIQIKSDDGERCAYDNLFIPTYIFWKNNNKTFVTRKDNCFDFEIIEIQKNDFWKIIYENKKVIINEKNKKFEFIDKKSKLKLNKSISHSHYRRFELFLTNYTCEKFFNDFDLTEFDNGDLNINYVYNNSTKSKLLMDELEKIVNELKTQNLFRNKTSRL